MPSKWDDLSRGKKQIDLLYIVHYMYIKMRKTGGLLAQGLFQRRWPVIPMTRNYETLAY